MNLVINDIYSEYFLSNQDRYAILIGGRGSGKSYAVAQKIILRCCQEKNHKLLVVRKTLPALKRSCWALINRLISEIKIPNKINKTEMSIQINSNIIMFISLDDPEKIKSIEGITTVWVEEASELNENEFRNIDLILRGETKYYKQIMISLNPINELLWLNKMFCYDMNLETEVYKRNESAQKMVLKTTYKDNLFIDEEYKNILENLKFQNKNLYRISALGIWGGNKGIIYNNYEIRGTIPDCLDKIYGLDFGFNNPTALVEVGIKDGEYYLRQMLYETGLTNNDLIKELEILNIDKSARIYCDCAEPARIEELRRAGYNCFEAEKSISDGIDYVKSQKLYIEEMSTDLIKEIKTYSWQEKKDGSIIDVPVKEWDHLCLVGNTKIKTIFGNKRIDKIKKGDFVLTRNGYNQVLESKQTGIKQVIEKNFNKNKLIGTKDHPVILKTEKKELHSLTQCDINDIIFYDLMEDIIWMKVFIREKLLSMELYLGVTRNQITEQCDCITRRIVIILSKAFVDCINIYGQKKTALFLKDFVYIIKIGIRLTMKYQILNVLKIKNTVQNIQKYIIKNILNLQKKQPKGIKINVENGINQKKGLNGINNMRKSTILELFNMAIQNAVCVIRNLKKRSMIKNIVVPIVKLNIIKKQKVYNITVKNYHEYYANNILVSNCDALRYAIFTHKSSQKYISNLIGVYDLDKIDK